MRSAYFPQSGVRFIPRLFVFVVLFFLPAVLPFNLPAFGVCDDISGDWDYSDDGTVRCSGGGETYKDDVSDSGTITIEQDGCTISWDAGYDASRNGSIKGRSIKVSGECAVALVDGVDFTKNTYTAKGTINGDKITLRGKGKASGSYEGIRFSCTVKDTVVLTRSSSDEEDEEYVRKPLVKRKPSRKFSTSFSDDSFENIPKCVPIKIIGE